MSTLLEGKFPTKFYVVDYIWDEQSDGSITPGSIEVYMHTFENTTRRREIVGEGWRYYYRFISKWGNEFNDVLDRYFTDLRSDPRRASSPATAYNKCLKRLEKDIAQAKLYVKEENDEYYQLLLSKVYPVIRGQITKQKNRLG